MIFDDVVVDQCYFVVDVWMCVGFGYFVVCGLLGVVDVQYGIEVFVGCCFFYFCYVFGVVYVVYVWLGVMIVDDGNVGGIVVVVFQLFQFFDEYWYYVVIGDCFYNVVYMILIFVVEFCILVWCLCLLCCCLFNESVCVGVCGQVDSLIISLSYCFYWVKSWYGVCFFLGNLIVNEFDDL